MSKKVKKLYEGKAKVLYETDEPDLLIQTFKDDATAGDGEKRGTILRKGAVNNSISSRLFEVLAAERIRNHFVKKLNEVDMLVKRLRMFRVEVTVRNIAAGGLSRTLGIPEGEVLKYPVLEYHLKDDELHDPLINSFHIRALDLADDETLGKMEETSFRTNEVLERFLSERNIDLVDFKLEFGTADGEILIGDEISPDTCRFWDSRTRDKLDKDRFRRDLGGVEEAYEEVRKRICGVG
ncbi:MAG: phosphoribosylaminoimidazolesuccinocarboxamide synthase [bacterium]